MRITINIPPAQEARVLAAVAEAATIPGSVYTPDKVGLKQLLIDKIKRMVRETERRAVEKAARDEETEVDIT